MRKIPALSLLVVSLLIIFSLFSLSFLHPQLGQNFKNIFFKPEKKAVLVRLAEETIAKIEKPDPKLVAKYQVPENLLAMDQDLIICGFNPETPKQTPPV